MGHRALALCISGRTATETWLDAYLSKALGLPYYVALLNAAEVYGASPQAVMVTQIMSPKVRRPVQVGRHRLDFFESARIPDMPTIWHKTPHGRFKVSSPALTILDLVAKQKVAGGMGLHAALDALDEIPTAQRIGVLFMQANQPNL